MFVSLEGALNSLVGDAELLSGGIAVPLTGSDARVTERRGEAAVGATWWASRSISVEPSLRAEYSRIRSSGDSVQDDSFLFWKPRLRVSWVRYVDAWLRSPDGRWRVRERVVHADLKGWLDALPI